MFKKMFLGGKTTKDVKMSFPSYAYNDINVVPEIKIND